MGYPNSIHARCSNSWHNCRRNYSYTTISCLTLRTIAALAFEKISVLRHLDEIGSTPEEAVRNKSKLKLLFRIQYFILKFTNRRGLAGGKSVEIVSETKRKRISTFG
jgi:hypothetical protein